MGSKRERSPNYPYLGLDTAIELTKKLYDAAKAGDIRVTDIAETWGLSPTSGSLARYASALGQFGLIVAGGSGAKRRIKISPIGRRIIEDNRPGVREDLCAEAALRPPIIRELFLGSDRITAWGHDRPVDRVAESALQFDLSFTPDAAKKFLSVYDESIKFIPEEERGQNEFDEEGEIDEGDVPIAGTLRPAGKHSPEVRTGDLIQWTSNGQDQFGSPSRVRAVSEDGRWVFVEDSQTGIPVQEITVVERFASAPVSAAPPTLPLPRAATPQLELNQIVFKSEGDGVISISCRVDAEGLARLEKKIAAFKLLL